MTEFKVDKPDQHSVSIACYMHSKCRKVMLMKRAGNTFQPDVLRWLAAALELPGRSRAPEHLEMSPVEETLILIEFDRCVFVLPGIC